MKALSRLIIFCKNCKSSPLSTSTAYPFPGHLSQNLSKIDKRTSETGFPYQSSSEPSVPKKPTSQPRFSDEPISETGDSETPSSQIGIFKKPISETVFSEEPTSETGIPDKPMSKTGSLEDPASETEFSGNPNSENSFPDKPTSQNSEEIISCSSDSFLTQDSVIEFLLLNRHDPNTALEFFHWAENRRGVVRGIDALCIMLHILVCSRRISSAQKLLNRSFSGTSIPSAGIFIERLIESSKRCDSHPCLFDYVINSYLRAGRIEEAVESFDRMIENNIFPGITSRNILLAALVRLNLTGKARELYQVMQYKGMDCDCFTLDVVMNACLKEGKPDEAEEYFRDMKFRGFKLDSITYTTMIQAVCERPDSRKACELLEEMKGLGWNPSEATYTIVIEACMKQGNLQEALRLEDEVISNVGRLNFDGYK
ncbi:hypothetical protein AAC387_Pa02g0681 [Persea americana]